MKKKTIALAGVALLLMLYSFNLKQKWNDYVDENGETVYVLDAGETMIVNGVEYTNTNSNGTQERWILCPGEGQTCSGTITTPAGQVISYSEYKGEGRKNIERVPDPK